MAMWHPVVVLQITNIRGTRQFGSHNAHKGAEIRSAVSMGLLVSCHDDFGLLVVPDGCQPMDNIVVASHRAEITPGSGLQILRFCWRAWCNSHVLKWRSIKSNRVMG